MATEKVKLVRGNVTFETDSPLHIAIFKKAGYVEAPATKSGKSGEGGKSDV